MQVPFIWAPCGPLLHFFLSLSQVKKERYQSELPNFLLQVVDQIIRNDPCTVLRGDSLTLDLELSVYETDDHPATLWLFVDPYGHNHLLSKAPHPLLPPSSQQPTSPPLEFPPETLIPASLICTNFLSSHLDPSMISFLKELQVVSIDQIRQRCQANVYTDPLTFDSHLRGIISRNQVFKAHSLKTFEYLSKLYESIVATLAKKDFFRKFQELKINDLNRLMREQYAFKLQPKSWPFIPTSFREYQELQQYVPTPEHRTPIINQRMCSMKKPIQCGPDCVCLMEHLPQGQSFCTYSLVNGWQTKCPNRLLKLECSHSDPQDQLRCRNSEIKKHQRKKCLGKGGQEQTAQIQERITWGIDYYTRNIIAHCLPQSNIDGSDNDEQKSIFIQQTLASAFNLLGPQGYDLKSACQYIMNHTVHGKSCLPEEKNQEKEISSEQNKGDTIIEENKKEMTMEEKKVEELYSVQDREYADILLRNYELAEDKTGFRVHTKGKGAICIDRTGIEPGTFIVQYFGEIYEPWRWYDREDFIKEIMKKKKFKNYMPEFYNISLEKHPDEPLGCDMLMVDPSRKGNFSSRFSHSCEPNCGTIITVSEGRYYIGMYSFKKIHFGQELTFDYCSMTESNFQHINSICLCGKKKCRGFYLQLSNTKMFSNLMDNKNCFFTRNSAILKANKPISEEDYAICAKSNIKEGLLKGSPDWLVKWIASVLKFIEEEGEIYQKSLVQSWRKHYPWECPPTQEQKQENIDKFSVTSRQQLQSIRLQNLLTSVDKIKYFLSKNEENQQPPICIQRTSKILDVLIFKQDSVLEQLQQNLICYKKEDLAKIIQFFIKKIRNTDEDGLKLSMFRLCCLIVSHRLLTVDRDSQFSCELLSDIVFFYAFTYTYFSSNQYKSFEAEEITVSVSQILGEQGRPNERREKSKKKYASPFMWGQMASWYKQTIVCPEASLSQDRRGTLSYPLIRSVMRSEYPYEKNSRNYFLRVIQDRPANSWPPAEKCNLSFKNPYKLYGTLLFENVHSKEILAGKLPKESLLESCLSIINGTFSEKLSLFKIVEEVLGELPQDHELYSLIDEEGNLTISPVRPATIELAGGQPRKQIKQNPSPPEQ